MQSFVFYFEDIALIRLDKAYYVILFSCLYVLCDVCVLQSVLAKLQ